MIMARNGTNISRTLPVPNFISSVESPRGSTIIFEYAGKKCLDEILPDKNEKEKKLYAKKAIDILIKLHYYFSLYPTAYDYVRDKENFSEEMLKNIGKVILKKNSDLFGQWKSRDEDILRNDLRPITDILEKDSYWIIHGEYSPQNIVVNDKKMYALDLEHVSVAPWQFDLVNLLKHPCFDFNYKTIHELFEYFLVKRTNSYIGSVLHVKSAGIGSLEDLDNDYVKQALKIFYFSNIFNDLRTLGFSYSYKDSLEKNIHPSKESEEWYTKDLENILVDTGELQLLDSNEDCSVQKIAKFCNIYKVFDA